MPASRPTGLYYALSGNQIKIFLPSIKGQCDVFQGSHPELKYIHFNNLEHAKRWLSQIQLRRPLGCEINSWETFWSIGKYEQVLWIKETAHEKD